MSATNRGNKRNESDFYITPEWCIDLFLKEFNIHNKIILEPCAGNGAIVKTLKNNTQNNYIIANEIREEETDNLFNSGANEVYSYNLLDIQRFNKRIDLVITNPPYSIAQEIIEKCFELAPNAEIVMLLRLAFLESNRRREFWNKYPLTQLYPLLKRPSFTGKGTDATAYGWFIWSQYRDKLIKSI